MTEINAKLVVADEKNANGRIYPREHLEKAVAEQSKKDRTWVTLGMCEGTTVEVEKIAGQAGEFYWDGNTLCAKVVLMETPMGKIAKQLIDNFQKNSISADYRLAGVGNIDEDGVVTDYRMSYVAMLAPGTGA